MKVLVITGDKTFGPGHPRYDLQRSVVDELAVVYWGRGTWWPRIPWRRFDVITAQDPFLRGHLANHLCQLTRAKLNIQVHTDLEAQSSWRRMFARVQLRHADSVRVVSEKIKRQVLAMAPHARVTVLPVFVDVARFKNIVHRPEPNTILWVGRFEDEKDPLCALEMLKQVPGAKLIMLGKGSLEKQLRRGAAGLPVEFVGWQDPASYLARAAVVLSTSRHESFGVSIIEALAAGVPVVAPDVGIAREAGAIVVPREQLASAVADALKNGTRGQLQLQLPNAQEWAQKWKESLS